MDFLKVFQSQRSFIQVWTKKYDRKELEMRICQIEHQFCSQIRLTKKGGSPQALDFFYKTFTVRLAWHIIHGKVKVTMWRAG